jgi:hypothetical protein
MPSKTFIPLLAVFCWLAPAPILAQAVPRPEHPRPDFQRANWLNLNGAWDFRFDPGDAGVGERWWESGKSFGAQKITVPFCWQSSLSGIRDASGQKIGWYRRTVAVPAAWKGSHAWLRFDAVKGEARVWANGKELGAGKGSAPLEFDLAGVAEAGQEVAIVVRVLDASTPTEGHPNTSGIWQTVWLEARPARFIAQFSLSPRKAGEQWFIDVDATASGPPAAEPLRLSYADGGVEARDITFDQGRARASLAVRNPKPWTPETPSLYDITLRLGQDTVQTYLALRTMARGKYGDLPNEAILLNGEPIYVRGALDRSMNPLGLSTAPNDAFLRRDIELAKGFGLNFLQVPTAEPRLLYWADRLGILTTQAMGANADGILALLNREASALPADGGDRSIASDLVPLINQLRRDEKSQGYVYRQLADFEWEHNGLVNYDRTRKEFGYDSFVPGMTLADLQGEDAIVPAASSSPGTMNRFTIRCAPGWGLKMGLAISHFSKRTEAPVLRWYLMGMNDLGEPFKMAPQTRAVKWNPYRVVEQTVFDAQIPGERPFVGALVMELLDQSGKRIAANFIPIAAKNAPAGRVGIPEEERIEVLGPRLVALRFNANKVSESARFAGESKPGKISATGEVAVEYRVPVPDFVQKAGPVRFDLIAELATRAGQAKVDWPQRQSPGVDYPQTEERKFPGTVRIRIGGADAGEVQLADDPADARGAISNMIGADAGSYGYVTRVSAPAHAMSEVTVRFEATNGLSIYGEGMGRYGVDPVILVHTSNDVGRPTGNWFPEEPPGAPTAPGYYPPPGVR